MESEPPFPGTVAPPPTETALERHTRELESSVDALEGTIQRAVIRAIKIAIPLAIGVFLAAVGSYVLGGYMRDRAERRDIARAMRRDARGR
jgi:hypothetical protein